MNMQKIGGGSREKKIALLGSSIKFISIVSNKDRVCNLYFGTGDGPEDDIMLDQTGECDMDMDDSEGLFANVLSVSPKYPLVGLHGTVDTKNQWIIDLGIIWLDTENPRCR